MAKPSRFAVTGAEDGWDGDLKRTDDDLVGDDFDWFIWKARVVDL